MESLWPELLTALRRRGTEDGVLRLSKEDAFFLLDHLGAFRQNGEWLWDWMVSPTGFRLYGIPVELID